MVCNKSVVCHESIDIRIVWIACKANVGKRGLAQDNSIIIFLYLLNEKDLYCQIY